MESSAPASRRPPSIAIVVLALVVVAVAAGLVVLARDAVARTAIAAAARSMGYSLTTGRLHLTWGGVAATDVRVSSATGEPVFDARGITVAYSLRDLLPGGSRRFGLKAVDLDAPHVVVIHHRDGSYNINLPKTSNAPARPNTTPIDVRVRMRNGSIDMIDDFVAAPRERRSRIVGAHLDAVLSPVERSYYHAGATVEEDGGRYPIVGNARFEDARGFEVQHWTIGRLPIAALTNFALPNRALVVDAGDLRDLDVKLGALRGRDGSMDFHLSARGSLTGGRIALAALAKPIRDAHGTFVASDDSLAVPAMDATLNGVPLHLRGALYRFSDPQLAFALGAGGALERLRDVSADVAKMPLAGRIAVEGIAEGPAGAPVAFARFRSPRVTYGAFAFDRPSGFVAVSGQELDVLSSAVHYGPVEIGARGAVLLRAHTQTTAFATLRAPASGLPYAAAVVGDLPLAGVAVVNGVDGRLATRGALAGARNGSRLDAPFSVGSDGVGTIGPVVLTRRDGATAYVRVALDRPHGTAAAVLETHALALLPARRAALPGFTPPALPPRIDGRLDAALAGTASGSRVDALSGFVHGYGRWGDLRADAGGSAAGIVARGRFTSSFERLAAFTGNVGARGGIDVPFAAEGDGRTTDVQVAGARFAGASVHGVPLEGMDATLRVRPRAVDVLAADVRAAHRHLSARGSFGNGGRLVVTAGDLDPAAFRSAGVPLQDGRMTALAVVGGTFARPVARFRAALAGARYHGQPVSGNVALRFGGDTLHVDGARVAFGGAFADADGTIAGLAPGRAVPRYDLHAAVRDADVATLARSVSNPLRYPAGTLDADVRVGGAGAVPRIAGAVHLPEGSINGLAFRDARVAIDGTPAALTARNGRASVGSTTLAFNGDISATHRSFAVRAPHVDLADFNDYFDEADVLAGHGRLALALDASATTLRTSGDAMLRGLRYRRFELGNAAATLRSSGDIVRTQATLAGPNGRVAIGGSVAVPHSDPTRDLIRRAGLDVSARVAGLQLGNVLPAAGISAPVVGRVDATAAVRGRYPALALRADAALTGGAVGRVPIRRLHVAASAEDGRGQITSADLATNALQATANGSFGLRTTDPFDLSARIVSPNLDALALEASGKPAGVGGSLETRLRARGTTAQPHLTAATDVANLTYRGIAARAVHADLDASRTGIAVRNGAIVLSSGTVAFDGSAPLDVRRAGAPIAFNLAPQHVDVTPFSSLLPDRGVLHGTLDGRMGVRGTLAAPALTGGLAFAGGSFHSASLKSPVTAMALQLQFAGTRIHIAKLHGHLTPGNVDGTGTIDIGDLRDPARALAADVHVQAKNALLDLPKLYIGFVDGAIVATKAPGAIAHVDGNVTFSSGRIPYQALLPGGAAPPPNAAPAVPVAFDLGITAGRDIRVEQGPVDIGASGHALLGGTLGKPTLDGRFTAADGQISFYRTFTLQPGSSVAFDPSNGVVPSVDATGTTHITDPSTDILLHITGPATQLNLAFASEPPEYTREQIVGLLVNAQALGAVPGVASTAGGTAPGGSSAVAGFTEGFINQQFARSFLEPLSSKLGGAIGLSDLNVSYGLNGAVSAIARRTLGHDIALQYGETFGGQTPRTSLGLSVGGQATSLVATFYSSQGSSQAFGGNALTPYLQSGFLQTEPTNYTLQSIEPPSGGSGFVFTYQHHFY